MTVYVVVLRAEGNVKVFANKVDAEAYAKEYNYWHDGGCYIKEANVE